MNDYEYYLIDGDNNPNIPLLRAEDDQDSWFIAGDNPVDELAKPMKLCFNSPIPKKPIMTDYHSLPKSVIFQKIATILKPLNIYGIQLIPAEIRNNNTNETYSNYYVIYVYNKIQCLDMKNAEYKISESSGKVRAIKKLVLDKEILAEIPLEKRLVFLLKEALSSKIYHKSVVDAIMVTNPEGIMFTPIEEWYEGIQFRQ